MKKHVFLATFLLDSILFCNAQVSTTKKAENSSKPVIEMKMYTGKKTTKSNKKSSHVKTKTNAKFTPPVIVKDEISIKKETTSKK